MQSFLEDLYNGKIYPAERPWSPSPELREMQLKNDEGFEAKLRAADPSLVEDFSAWQDAEAEVAGAVEKHRFIYGFRLGAQMMLEILSQT